MSRTAFVGAIMGTVLAVFCTSCEWEGAGDGWSDNYSWVNFSGLYRGMSGQPVVRSQGAASATSSSSNLVAAGTTTESIGTGTGAANSFGDTLSSVPVIPGSVFVTDGYESFTDVATPGALVGDKGGTGSVNYNTGAIAVTFGAGIIPAPGTSIDCTYQFAAGGGGGGGGTSKPGKGTGSTLVVHTMNVFQQGNLLSFRDSNGATYEGKMGDLSSTGGFEGGNTMNGSTVVAQFNAGGVSANGRQIEMVGTFSGTFVMTSTSGSTTSTGIDTWMLTSRTIQGTWIEDGGVVTGDIYGEAASVSVSNIVSGTNSAVTIIP